MNVVWLKRDVRLVVFDFKGQRDLLDVHPCQCAMAQTCLSFINVLFLHCVPH
mgnify:CR=1 FL=1